MPDTALGITYPASTGHARIWEHLQALAEDVDALLTKPPTGSASSTTTQTTTSTSETVSLTISNMLFKSGWAYRASIRTAVYGTTGALAFFRLRKTNASGTDYGELGRVACEGTVTGSAAMANGSLILVRSAGTDLTTNVALTTSTNTGTINLFASASSPRYLLIEPIGKASDYAGLGVDVT